MKILLARPPAPNSISFTGILSNEPIELEYLHTALMYHGYKDYIFDGMVEQIPFEKILEREKPDIIAITGYISQENLMKNFALAAKKFSPTIITIVGGVHGQLNYKRFYSPEIDYIARSASMDAFIELVQYIETGKGEIEKINGICYKSDEVYLVNDLTPVDINTLPIPERTHFYKYKDRFRYLDLAPIAIIKTSFSCPFDCNFCYCTMLNTGQYATRDLALIIEEIENIDCDNIQIVDDDFLVDRNRIMKFVAMIKERNIKKTFVCYARADFVADNPDIVELLSDIGFKYFMIGLEAVNNGTLASYNKKTTDEINQRCVQNINRTKGHCVGLFIVGIDATIKDFDDIITWVEKTGIKYVTVSIFTPMPGTKLYEDNKHLITAKKDEQWDFLHLVMKPTNMSKYQYYRAYYNMFMKLYKIAEKTGIYDFMDMKFYKKMLRNYLKRKMLGL